MKSKLRIVHMNASASSDKKNSQSAEGVLTFEGLDNGKKRVSVKRDGQVYTALITVLPESVLDVLDAL